MKKLFTFLSILCLSFSASAANVSLPSSPYIWTESSGLAASDQDVIVVKNGEVLIINNPAAPNVSISIESGGVCNIQNISNQSGGNILVNNGAVLNIAPIADITIGQNIEVVEAGIPLAVNNGNALDLMDLVTTGKASTLISAVNITGSGVYPKITFAGDVTIGYGAIFNVGYPAAQTDTQIEFTDLYFSSAIIPQEFIPLLKMLLPAEYQAQASKLDSGVVPPVLLYKSGSLLPNITGGIKDLELKVLEIDINLGAFIRGQIEGAMPGTIPANGTYISQSIDLSQFSIHAPDTFSGDVPITITVPHTDSQNYTAILPQVSSNTNLWYLIDSEDGNIKLDLSDADKDNRTYTIPVAGGTSTRLSLTVEPKQGTSIEEESADYGKVLSVEYYTLAGKQISNPVSGILIKKTVFESGKMKTEKVMLK